MDKRLIKLLTTVKDGSLPVEEAYEVLSKDMPYEDLHHTKVDHHRSVRKGLQEVIFGEGKTSPRSSISLLRCERRKWMSLSPGLKAKRAERSGEISRRHLSRGRPVFLIKKDRTIKGKGTVLVVSAGTSDIPVAEEAYVTSLFFGNETEKLYDVGVAGIHRFFGNLDVLREARVIIVAAGMEGALPSVVAGIVGVPVIAVPTSIGYGASFGGLTALLAMLNSCSTVSVFNIDNGFGAAYFATLINRL